MTTLVTAIRAAIRAAKQEGLSVDRITVLASEDAVLVDVSAAPKNEPRLTNEHGHVPN